MSRIFDHSYIFFTIIFTVYSQLIMRWQVGKVAAPPEDLAGKAQFLFSLLLTPWVLSGVFATFLAGLSWMLAMSRFQLSYAFPFVSLNYVLVLIASVLLFGETFTLAKGLGVLAILAGLFIIAKG
jgi:drug/metabolite transporter (DMT)-like permease